MLQVLILAPYLALGSTFLLTFTVAIICWTQRARPVASDGFNLRYERKESPRRAKAASPSSRHSSRPQLKWASQVATV
jgi:hypothetical protein